MAIELTCDCGKGYRLNNDKAGKRFKCRDCSTLIQVPSADDNDSEVSETNDEVTGELLPVRRRAGTKSGSAKKKSRKKSSASTSGSKQPLIIGVAIAAVVLIGGSIAYASLQMPRQQFTYLFRILLSVGVALAYFVGYDQLCRHRIRYDVESYDGTIQSISWRPFQGAFFTRGWTQGKHAKFYEVSYKNRDGQTQHSLVCCHWFGTNWDV